MRTNYFSCSQSRRLGTGGRRANNLQTRISKIPETADTVHFAQSRQEAFGIGLKIEEICANSRAFKCAHMFFAPIGDNIKEI